MSESEAKALISGINFDDVTVKSVVSAAKGKGDDYDLFLAFYFDSVSEAEKFTSKNQNENLGLMHSYGERLLGANLTLKQGQNNNVSFVGSETSYSVAF